MQSLGASPDIGSVMAAVKRSLDAGTCELTPSRAIARLCGSCADPHMIDFTGQIPPVVKLPPSAKMAEWRSTWNTVAPYLWVTIHVPCRACRPCLRARATLWRGRAVAEFAAAPRSWFGTITLEPQAHALMGARAAHTLALGGEDFDALEDESKLAARHRECSIELTRYLKRVRKESGGSFRYLLVMEAHASGLPHYHALLHEREDGQVKHKCLENQWRLGFTKWRVAEATSAAYVTKYLTKAAQARVRASLLYGDLQYLTKYYALAA